MRSPFFSAGFRPMFMGASLWAAVSMLLWIGYWTNLTPLATAMDPLDWHVHELLFGYGGAVVCGFLLTAIPNWTGRPAVAGVQLAGLALIWLAGRMALLLGAGLWTSVVDLAFLGLVFLIASREIISGGNRRNMPVAGMVAVLWLANLFFHLDVLNDLPAYDGIGARLGMAVLIMLISLIGGRIVPAFTRNWLKAQGKPARVAEFGRADGVILLATGAFMVLWVLWPTPLVGAAFVGLGLAHLWRVARWQGHTASAEPLIIALHVAYLFVPIGFALTGISLLSSSLLSAAGHHAWTTGAIGGMTLIVMTRASLGHSGRPLVAGAFEKLFLSLIFLAAGARIFSALGIWEIPLLHLSATLWIGAFVIFVVRFTPIWMAPRS